MAPGYYNNNIVQWECRGISYFPQQGKAKYPYSPVCCLNREFIENQKAIFIFEWSTVEEVAVAF
jgi:hypothetical protein